MGDYAVSAVSYLVGAAIFAAIFRKAGYSPWLALLMLVPFVNFGLLLWFATTTWPLEMGYAGQDENPRVDRAWELKMALRKAATLERRGQREEAIRELEAVAAKAGDGHPNAALARERIAQIRAQRPT